MNRCRLSLRAALRHGDIELSGSSAVVRRLPAVLELSPIAETLMAATGR